MKTYRVTWCETTIYNAEVVVDDDATEEDIICEAERAQQHGEAWPEPSDGEMEDVYVQLIDDDPDSADDDDEEGVD